MKLDTLRKLYIEQLSDMHSAENQILKALPKLVKNAENPELKEALRDHLEVTKKQVQRLDKIFDDMSASPKRKKCAGMEGLLEEGEEMLEEDAEPEVLDAGIIASAQKVEHYEIATYGTLRAYAELLGETEAAELLEETLQEEKEADVRLSEIAEGAINLEAAGAAG